MNEITQSEISNAGGVLAALADKSTEAVRRILTPHFARPDPALVDRLQRIIVHTDPHLDEYFAELIFRACLPQEKWQCEFLEQAIFSATNDLGCQHLWPSAAVFGIGSTAAAGIMPIFLFDEHVAGQAKIAASCSQIVADKMLASVPTSVATVLREVNTIDEFGGGHPQNLGNLIKTLHEVRFWFGKDASDDSDYRDQLSPEWKRAIVDACLAAVLVCLHEGVDLDSDPAGKRASLSSSLENYVAHSIHVDQPRFNEAVQRMQSVFGDQARVFKDALLRDRTGPLKDASNAAIPQLLLFSKICFAVEYCWGERWRDLIATHFWEGELQKQLNFYAVESAISGLFADGKMRAVTPVGVFTRTVLPEIQVEILSKGPRTQTVKKKCRVWVIGIMPAPGVLQAVAAATNYLNRNNDGCGLILLRNTAGGTSALFKGSSLPSDRWRVLVDEIVSKEGKADPSSVPMGCWHVIYDSQGGMAPFVLNGNKAHQYVPRSGLDANVLSELVRRTFY